MVKVFEVQVLNTEWVKIELEDGWRSEKLEIHPKGSE